MRSPPAVITRTSGGTGATGPPLRPHALPPRNNRRVDPCEGLEPWRPRFQPVGSPHEVECRLACGSPWSEISASHVSPCSAAGQFLQVFGIASPLHRELRGGAIDLTEIVRRQFNVGCPDVHLQVLQCRGLRDGYDPRLSAPEAMPELSGQGEPSSVPRPYPADQRRPDSP
jgi:hypothetical protein